MGNDPYNEKSVTFFSSATPVITPIKREIQYKIKINILFYFIFLDLPAGKVRFCNLHLVGIVSPINYFDMY
jgi:hypothetical protein